MKKYRKVALIEVLYRQTFPVILNVIVFGAISLISNFLDPLDKFKERTVRRFRETETVLLEENKSRLKFDSKTDPTWDLSK